MHKHGLRLATIRSRSNTVQELKPTLLLDLGLEATNPDDVVTILRGCSVPVVLRRHNDGYIVVGMAVVHSVMEGQMIEEYSSAWKSCKLSKNDADDILYCSIPQPTAKSLCVA